MTPHLTSLPLCICPPLPAPSTTTPVQYLATKCVDTTKHRQEAKLFMPWGPDQCEKIRTFDEAMAKKIEANNIVFAVHIPLPNKEMSPWFQFMLVILQFDIAFKMYNQIGERRGFLTGFQRGRVQRCSCFSPPRTWISKTWRRVQNLSGCVSCYM